MECFPPACRDKEAGALGELSQSPVHILLVTFVTRDGVRAVQSRHSLTLLCGAPVPPCARARHFSARMPCRDEGLFEKHIQRRAADSCDGCLTLGD